MTTGSPLPHAYHHRGGNTARMKIPLGILFCLFALVVAAGAAEPAPSAKPNLSPKPSKNAGRRGTYEADLPRNAQYKYWVYVPGSYSDVNPAGIHLFIHGDKGMNSAKEFTGWKKYFCDPFNLIGVNLQFLDDDLTKDADDKTLAAQEALAQVMADYLVVPRGVISSFVGGGLEHANWFQRAAGPTSATWPFTHNACYHANFQVEIANAHGMTWFLDINDGFWKGVGGTILARMNELLTLAVKKNGTPDAYLNIEKNLGWGITDHMLAASAAMFRRGDLAQGQFLREESWTGKAKSLAAQANSLALGQAAAAIDKALAGKTLADTDRSQLEDLNRRVETRVADVLSLSKELAENDAVLALWYGPIFTQQLKGHPRAKELKDIFAAMAKAPAARDQLKAREAFVTLFPDLFDADSKGLRFPAKNVPLLDQIGKLAGDASLTGMMARGFQ
jgi:hypothetical protein